MKQNIDLIKVAEMIHTLKPVDIFEQKTKVKGTKPMPDANVLNTTITDDVRKK